MHMADGDDQVATSVAVDDDDVATFRKLQDLGVELEIKRVLIHQQKVQKNYSNDN